MNDVHYPGVLIKLNVLYDQLLQLKHWVYHQELIEKILRLPFKIPISAYVDNCSIIEALKSTKQVDEFVQLKNQFSKMRFNQLNGVQGLHNKGAQYNLLLHTILKGRITF